MWAKAEKLCLYMWSHFHCSWQSWQVLIIILISELRKLRISGWRKVIHLANDRARMQSQSDRLQSPWIFLCLCPTPTHISIFICPHSGICVHLYTAYKLLITPPQPHPHQHWARVPPIAFAWILIVAFKYKHAPSTDSHNKSTLTDIFPHLPQHTAHSYSYASGRHVNLHRLRLSTVQ